MGKISPVSSKYIVHSTIEVDGVVDKPDVIGAIFGQTEGLLGSELELRELQRSGRIGRIEVEMDTRSGKSKGTIIIPSSLDQAETVIIAAALEIIQRIGPCNAKVKVEKIYHCPHHPEFTGSCDCRKPKTGMVQTASREFGFNPADCIYIGDKDSDTELGKNCGGVTVLIDNGQYRNIVPADFKAKNIEQAFELLKDSNAI